MNSTTAPKVFIETIGCAMNSRDSEHLFAELKAKEGYEQTNDPKDADLILINTCSVRERPVSKLFSELGTYNLIKKEGAKIGVCGCTASHLAGSIFKRAPYVNFVIGARNVSKITEALHKDKSVFTDTTNDETLFEFSDHRTSKYSALVNISVGCDKECTYCIVPHTRGDELSIPLDLIVNEVKRAVDSGAIEVLLLGQNVNSYGRRFSDGNRKIDFVDLLDAVSGVDGLRRIRFQSPHPLHMDDRFLEHFATNPKIVKHIHMPLQSGSSRILKAMKRGYTKEWFLNRAAKLKELVPDVTIGTDIIVGFPSESDEDFDDTLEVLQTVKFEQVFSFKFSPRPHTEAAKMVDLFVDDAIASARLNMLQSIYKEQLSDLMNAQIGKTFEVFLEESSSGDGIYARSDRFYAFHIKGEGEIGTFAKAKAIGVEKGALVGQIVS